MCEPVSVESWKRKNEDDHGHDLVDERKSLKKLLIFLTHL